MLRTFTRPAFNPDFPHTDGEVLAVRAGLKARPRMPLRPIVLLSGYHSPIGQVKLLAAQLRKLTHAEAVMHCVGYAAVTEMPRIVAMASKSVRERFGDAEVDLVCISMGGLIARAIATDAELRSHRGVIPKREAVNARRVFTLSSPHRGAILADKVRPDSAAKDLRAGSAFLQGLDAELERARYELVCYSRLHDGWVGATRASPHGRGVVWTPGLIVGSHFAASWDRRALTDLALRLRGETPLAVPGTPPGD